MHFKMKILDQCLYGIVVHYTNKEIERKRKYLFSNAHLFIYGYMASDNLVKDHSDNEKENLSSLFGLLFPINSKISFISTIIDRIEEPMYGLCHTSCQAQDVRKYLSSSTNQD